MSPFAQLLHRGRVRDSQIPGRIEAFARRQRDVLLLDQSLREVGGGVDLAAEQLGDIREQVERARAASRT